MLFNTPQFVFTLTAFIICWYILPNRWKKPVLLVFSYYYAYNSGGFWTAAALASVTLLTWLWAILLEKKKPGKPFVFTFVVLLVLLLVYEKYLPVFPFIDKSAVNVVSMVGVSYYVFSAISYIVDISRGKDKADRNLPDVAIWMAFFPKLLAGPIERHRHFKTQLDQLVSCKFNMEKIKRGLLICACGYFYKIVLADRISPFVNTVYSDVTAHKGFIVTLTMFLYMLQLYFDFAGYSMIAYGISYAIGFEITQNFDHPFFAVSVSDYWKRWHISLSSWLKDYVYIPLGGNRKGKIRQYLNLMITFLVSGIWHGTGVTFLIWGAAHAVLQIAEREAAIVSRLPKILRQLITFVFVSGTYIFFRADSFPIAKSFIKRLFQWDIKEITDGTLFNLGVDKADWIVITAGIIGAFLFELIQYKGTDLYKKLQQQNIIVRWGIYYIIIVLLIIFGKYGAAYDANNFVYFKF